MGSDSPPSLLFEAILSAARFFDPSITFVVLATQEIVSDISRIPYPGLQARIEYIVVSDFIAMGDEPLSAIRYKKTSSLLVGIKLLRKRLIQGFVFAGNTGALITAAKLYMPMLTGINRPALLATLPTQAGPIAVIDVGGNVSYKALHLLQFAKMGAVYQCCTKGIKIAKVGLLNIGIESKKGTSELRQAYQILKETQNDLFHFIGNIEGRDIFKGEADVLVTDGFTGNVLLKSSEGVASFIFDYIKAATLSQASLKPMLQDLYRPFDYAEYVGGILCGVEGVVVKCHGHSSAKAFFSGIKGAVHLVQQRLVERIKHQLSR
jgi:phosphate acyltransferase